VDALNIYNRFLKALKSKLIIGKKQIANEDINRRIYAGNIKGPKEMMV